jgi:hypothetical protein
VDALRNSTGLFTDAYLKKVDKVCVSRSNQATALAGYYTVNDVKRYDADVSRTDRLLQDLMADFGAVKAPKKWSAFKKASAKDMAAIELPLATLAATVKPNSSVASVSAAAAKFGTTAKPAIKRLNKRFDSQGLFRCGSAF